MPWLVSHPRACPVCKEWFHLCALDPVCAGTARQEYEKKNFKHLFGQFGRAVKVKVSQCEKEPS